MIFKLMTVSVCSALFFYSYAVMASAPPNVHPEIGGKTPNELLAKDVLALPERERQAWIHGAVSLMAQTEAAHKAGAGRCIMDWYFKSPDGHDLIMMTLNNYPDQRATASIYGVASFACKKAIGKE